MFRSQFVLFFNKALRQCLCIDDLNITKYIEMI